MIVNESTKRRIWVNPVIDGEETCTSNTGETIRLTYGIPGVDKKDIHLKMARDTVQLIATREDADLVNEYCFDGEADLEKVSAGYENGVLTVEIPTLISRPFKNTVSIKID
jgi:HSP20 family molecular chaperone IbpA